MTTKQPVLAIFGVGPLTKTNGATPADRYADNHLTSLDPQRNMIAIVQHYMAMSNVELVFCTGRPKRAFRVTWQWLNKHLGLTASGKRVSLVCRDDSEPPEHTPTCKTHEIVQAIRRVGSKPAEAFVYDDDLQNLRLFESLRPMVRHLHLFKIDDGVATPWSL